MNKLPGNIGPELIAAFLNQQISSEEAILVQNWINSSPENQKYFEQFKTVWEETGKLIPAPVDVDVDLGWNKMSFKIDSFEQKAQKKTHTFTPRFFLRIAAVIVPLIAIASIYFYISQRPKEIVKFTAMYTLQDTLSDGSIVRLNKNSKLTYPERFRGNTREVSMNGEMFFKIKPNKEKPFIIHTENTLIQVLGTSFNVKAISDSSLIEVYVESGHVKFSRIGKEETDTVSIILYAGEKGIYNKATKKLWKADLADANDLFWENRTLVFNRTELSQVINTIQKWYNITIVLKNENLKSLHFSATFKDQPVDSVINVISNTFDITTSRVGAKYIFDKNEQ